MNAWFDEVSSDGKFIKLPEGKTVNINVARIFKNNEPKFAPTKKNGERQEWAIEVQDEDGRILTVSSFALQREMINLKVNNGDRISIYHPKKGQYVVRKLDGNTPF